MSTTSPIAVQTVACLAALALMVLSGLKKRRLELRAAPARRPRLRGWRRVLRH